MKSWVEEQNEYNKTSLQHLGELKDTISEKLEQLCSTKKELERISKCMPSAGIKKSVKSRKRKEGKSKAKRRKRSRLENSKELISSKILKENNCTGPIKKAMLKLDELDRLQQRKHQAGSSARLKKKSWDLDARKCLKVKIVEREIDSSKQSAFQANLDRCNSSEGVGKVTPESNSDDENMETDEEEESEIEEETEEDQVEGVEEDINNKMPYQTFSLTR